MAIFLVEAGQSYEPHTIVQTCSELSWAMAAAECHMASDKAKYDDMVVIRALDFGPGRGVLIVVWNADRPKYTVWPCDGEGPPSEDPYRVTWRTSGGP